MVGTNSLQKTVEQRVLIYPAQTPKISGKQVSFLFTTNQVEDILREVSVHPVPFSPPFVEGIALWRDSFVPIISLEASLGMETTDPKQSKRLLVVRAAFKEASHSMELRSILRVDSSIHMLPLPTQSIPVTANGWLPRKNLVRGIYEYEKEILVVPHMEKLLNGGIEMDLYKTQLPDKRNGQ